MVSHHGGRERVKSLNILRLGYWPNKKPERAVNSAAMHCEVPPGLRVPGSWQATEKPVIA